MKKYPIQITITIFCIIYLSCLITYAITTKRYENNIKQINQEINRLNLELEKCESWKDYVQSNVD